MLGLATALVWPCDPAMTVGAVNASNGTSVQHSVMVSTVLDGVQGDWPLASNSTSVNEVCQVVGAALDGAVGADIVYSVELVGTAATDTDGHALLSLELMLHPGLGDALTGISAVIASGAVETALNQALGYNAADAKVLLQHTSILYKQRNETLDTYRQYILSTFLAGLDLPEGFHSCSDIPRGHASGVYPIAPTCGADPQQVYCDMDTDGGGWNLVGSSEEQALQLNSLASYYDDLQTIAPEHGHSGVWDGLVQRHPKGGDLRVSCSANVNSGKPQFDIDATAYDVNWYHQIVARSPAFASAAVPRVSTDMGLLNIIHATWGLPAPQGNCPDTNFDNRLELVRGSCQGQSRCEYWVADGDDVCPGQQKQFEALYDCGCGPQTFLFDDEAGGQTMYFDCSSCEPGPTCIPEPVNTVPQWACDTWPDSGSSTVCGANEDGTAHFDLGSMDVMTFDWNVYSAVMYDSFQVSFRACSSLVTSQMGGQMLLWYRNRPTTAAAIVSLSIAGETPSLDGEALGWTLNDLLGAAPSETATGVSLGVFGVRLESFTLPLLPAGTRWTVAWTVTIPNGLSVTGNEAVSWKLRDIVSQASFGWSRVVMSWGVPPSQGLRFSLGGRSYEYCGAEQPNVMAKAIFEAQRDSAEDPLFTDLQVFADVLTLSETEQERHGHTTVGRGITVRDDDTAAAVTVPVDPAAAVTVLDRSVSFQSAGWVTAWTACGKADLVQSTLLAQVWRPSDFTGAPCVDIDTGTVAPAAGTFLMQGVPPGRAVDLPAGAFAPTPGMWCPHLPSVGCQPREMPGCDTFGQTDCPGSHCQWAQAGGCTELGLSDCGTFDTYATCPLERCSFLAMHELVCSTELRTPEPFSAETASCGANEGAWLRCEVPYGEQCEVQPGDVVGLYSEEGFVQAGQPQGPELAPEVFTSAGSAQGGGLRTFASSAISGNLAYSLAATVRTEISSVVQASSAGVQQWSGAAGVFTHNTVDCSGEAAPFLTLVNVARIDDVSVCETLKVDLPDLPGLPDLPESLMYYKKTCLAAAGLQAIFVCDQGCKNCAPYGEPQFSINTASGAACTVGPTNCASMSIPGFSDIAKAVYPTCLSTVYDPSKAAPAWSVCADDTSRPTAPSPTPVAGGRACDQYSQSYCDAHCQKCRDYAAIDTCEGTGRCTWRNETSDPAVWNQAGSDHEKCEITGDPEHAVASQAACQEEADRAGASWYSHRYMDGPTNGCFYSTTCDGPITGTNVTWQRFSRTSPGAGVMTAELTLASDAPDEDRVGWEITVSTTVGDRTGPITSYDTASKVVEVAWDDVHNPPDTVAYPNYELRLPALCDESTVAVAGGGPDCGGKCVGFKHCLTCQPEEGSTVACPVALPNTCQTTDCSNVLGDDGIAYVLCDGRCTPQDVCHASGNIPDGVECAAISECASGSCAEHPQDCPVGCMPLPAAYCGDVTAPTCALLAQAVEQCPAEFTACEDAGARCRPIPCEPVSCMQELMSAIETLSAGQTLVGTKFWPDLVDSVLACYMTQDGGGGGDTGGGTGGNPCDQFRDSTPCCYTAWDGEVCATEHGSQSACEGDGSDGVSGVWCPGNGGGGGDTGGGTAPAGTAAGDGGGDGRRR